MSKKIEIIGQSLVITDTLTAEVLLDVPKSEYYYRSESLIDRSVIDLYNIDVDDNTRKNPLNIMLNEAVDISDVVFTQATFMDFARTNLGFKTVSDGGSGGDIVIKYQVDDYTELSAITGDASGELAYVNESQGTAWLPFSMGGTYYPKGIYMWNGVLWVSDRNAIASKLENPVIVTNASTSGVYEIDWTKDAYYLTLTGDTTLTDINLPSTGRTKKMQLFITGEFALTIPSDWAKIITGEYVGNFMNILTVNYIAPTLYETIIDIPYSMNLLRNGNMTDAGNQSYWVADAAFSFDTVNKTSSYDATVGNAQDISCPLSDCLTIDDDFCISFTIAGATTLAHFALWGNGNGNPNLTGYKTYANGRHHVYGTVTQKAGCTLMVKALNSGGGTSFTISNIAVRKRKNR